MIELLPHCSSTPRGEWAGGDDERPLSEKGLREAEVLAAVAAEGVQGVYTSPALRCRQSVGPLAATAGVSISVDERLQEGFDEPADWVGGVFAPIGQALGGAWTAARGVAVLGEVVARHQGGRAVVCSHGDLIPVVLAHLASIHGCSLPTIVDRGGWFRLNFTADGLSMTGIHPDA
ncbi:histidine phosphatase family protein [Kribbella sp. NPDC058245]|uniref:histidine phosphatase family protein n=1 Tax=Kribbella sp. NPDC058245 TaxID=3346399 RepID=UPI0036E6A10C